MFCKLLLPVIAAALLSGCMGDGNRRVQGLTEGAGNAIAANTVMQMVDPWPAGVDDTDLRVPAERAARVTPVSAPGTSNN